MLELGLKDKVAIITGGSDGLGRASALRLAAEGAKVAIAARRADHLQRAAEEIRAATGADVLAVPAEMTVAADCERLAQAALARWGRVDILFNNAGTAAGAAFADVTDDAWQADWDLKVMGAVRMMRLVLPHMQRQRDGRIVNITTVAGKAPRPRGVPTSVTRATGAGGIRQRVCRPLRLPRVRSGCLHHRHRDQLRWRLGRDRLSATHQATALVRSRAGCRGLNVLGITRLAPMQIRDVQHRCTGLPALG
jgi:NAD(P)-dependent dehydrogenase (short-subunit alcohol dehydrogenase family)